MIPHRMLSDVRGSGLKERVSACRKRLRVNRVTHRPHALDDADELFPDTAQRESEFQICTRDYPETPKLLVRMNYSPAYEVSEFGESGILLLSEEQEVGIT